MFDSKNKQILNEVVNDISGLKETKIKAKINKNTMNSIKGIYLRINKGKLVFKNITKLILNSVMQLSSLDLLLKDKSEKIDGVRDNIENLMEGISKTSNIAVKSSKEVVSAHRNMTQSINELSASTAQLLENIESSESELEEVKRNSESAMNYSRGMSNDMKNLISVVDNVQGVISAICEISNQTNLLALNASIEAARAGESGRGFSIVASEIRNLSDETKILTERMSKFVNDIEYASSKSEKSVENTVTSLEEINKSINSIVEFSKDNKLTIGEITSEIVIVANRSEEISGYMGDVASSIQGFDGDIEELNKDIQVLGETCESLKGTIEPIEKVEDDLHKAATLVGEIVDDPYYTMDNNMFIEIIESAITAHKKWLETLNGIATNGKEVPIQLNDHKCAFGHFYYAIKPRNNKILGIWNGIESQHMSFHGIGSDVINAIRKGNSHEASELLIKCEDISSKLINDFVTIIKMTRELENESVFHI